MYSLPPLPYANDALEPVIGATTMQTHHDKHHQRYVTVTNELAGTSRLPLEDLIADASKRGDEKLFNNAAQAWNHAFFWESMSPKGGGPAGALEDAIASSFHGLEGLKKEFTTKGAAHFGSGWTWLVAADGKLKIVTTHDAGVPWLGGATNAVPLLVCDVWEHAYYLDYKNERDRYLGAWFDKLANWNFAARQFSGSRYRYPEPT